MNPYLMPSFFLVGAIAFFFMTYYSKKHTNTRTFFSGSTGLLLLLFSIMGYLKFKNYIIIAIIIVSYYLSNAVYDNKHRKTKPLPSSSKVTPNKRDSKLPKKTK